MGGFRSFLLLEQEDFLAQKVGDVLAALQSLSDDSGQMGNRQIIKIADNIVQEMRKILESRWSKEEEPHLRSIQKAAVAMAKAIDTNVKMVNIIAGAKSELEKVQKNIGAPLHDLGAGIEKKKGSEDDPSV
jgi:hypothetical protein